MPAVDAPPRGGHPLLQLQRAVGNRGVQQLLRGTGRAAPSPAGRRETPSEPVARVQRWVPPGLPGLTSQLVHRVLLHQEVERLGAVDATPGAADIHAALNGTHPFESVPTAVAAAVRRIMLAPTADQEDVRRQEATTLLTLVRRQVLVRDVLQAIAQHETGERAIESNMRTSAGVRASLASQVQATIAWSISALFQLDDDTLHDEFALTRQELLTAQNRAARARQLWDIVHSAAAGTTVAQLLTNPAVPPHLAASGLTQAELGTMLEFRELRLETETARVTRRTELEALGNQQLFDRATPADRTNVGVGVVAHLANAQRRTRLITRTAAREAAHDVATTSPRPALLGIRETDIFAYARGNWAEDRAAWMRLAVSRDPAGAQIEAAATADEGLQLGRARIARVVRDHLAANPGATDEQVCRHAASLHNPGAGAPYVNAVLARFRAIRAP